MGGVFVCQRVRGHRGKHLVTRDAGLPGKPIKFRLEWTGDSRFLYKDAPPPPEDDKK